MQRLVTAAGALLVAGLLLTMTLEVVPRALSLVTDASAPAGADVGVLIGYLARMLGVSLSMIVSLCAIAIPLTANVYTPKLIELFVADRTNRVVVGFYVAANAFVLWNLFAVGDRVAWPTPHVRAFVCLALTLVALAAIVPYIVYLLRFLVPRKFVQRLADDVLEDLNMVSGATDEEDIADIRADALENLKYLGNVALRSVDRYDRDTAFEALKALRALFDAYQAKKDILPAAWFRLRERDLHGLGPELGREVERKRAAFEVAILVELSLVLPLAMTRLPEVVGFVAGLTRRFGVRTGERRDQGARELVTLFFNTFLRSALQQRSSDAVYKFVYQYRRFAEEALDRDPEHACRVAFFLDYYGHQAKRMGMGYLLNVVAYDLSCLCELAWRKNSPVRESLLGTLLALDRDDAGLMEMPGVIKAQVILAAKLRTRGEAGAAARIEAELQKVPRPRLEDAFEQIVAAQEENFWEIADRRRHLDHVEPEFRAAVDVLRAALTGHHEPGMTTQRFLRGVGGVPVRATPGAVPPAPRLVQAELDEARALAGATPPPETPAPGPSVVAPPGA